MEYSVKSGYWAATHDLNEDESIPPPAGAVPTYVQLCYRGINIDPVCQRCCLEEETINHTLFLCPHAFAVWRCSSLSVESSFTENLEDNIELLFQFMSRVENQQIGQLPFWVMWFVWKSRNEFLFQKGICHPVEDFQRANLAHMEWFKNREVNSGQVSAPSKSSQWCPPPSGWLKCNFDASFHKGYGVAGLGWIVRNSEGQFVGAGVVHTDNIFSALQAEAMGFLYALQQVWIRGWRYVWFEGDSLQLSTIINTRQWNNVELGNILHDIGYWISLLPLCSIGAVNRERNAAADILSKHYRMLPVDHMLFSSPPSWLIPYLYWPYTA